MTARLRELNADDTAVGRVWSFRDVTERKRAERERERLTSALATKHELLRSVVDHAPVEICARHTPRQRHPLLATRRRHRAHGVSARS